MFFPTPIELFFTKNDSSDLRLGDIFKNYHTESSHDDFMIFGYPDDEGIRLNGGRVGSASAPLLVRQFLYKMTLPQVYFSSEVKNNSFKNKKFQDYGNLEISNDLYTRHETAKKALTSTFSKKTKVITFGGGHDYGYPDGAAFIKNYFKATAKKPLIINFDAHLDVRPSTQNLNSGTPFYRLLTEFKDQFNLLEIGLQPQCNSVNHWAWAHEQGAQTISLEQIETQGWDIVLKNKFITEVDISTPVLISFDIDALAAYEAGGCSQAWATGLKVADCLKFLNTLYKKADVRGIGIYEVSPPLDRDFQTSKTAALLAYNFIFNS